jgi:hypothetical protein
MARQLPAQGPGCRPLTGLRSARFPEEPATSAPELPRREALAREAGAKAAHAQPGKGDRE